MDQYNQTGYQYKINEPVILNGVETVISYIINDAVDETSYLIDDFWYSESDFSRIKS